MMWPIASQSDVVMNVILREGIWDDAAGASPDSGLRGINFVAFRLAYAGEGMAQRSRDGSEKDRKRATCVACRDVCLLTLL